MWVSIKRLGMWNRRRWQLYSWINWTGIMRILWFSLDIDSKVEVVEDG